MDPSAKRESKLARSWRRWAVTRLVPVVVHRANNAVAAQLGAADLLVRRSGDAAAHLDGLHGGAHELGELLGAFSRLAKPAPESGDAEVGEALRGAERLLAGLVHERSGHLALEPPQSPVVVGLSAWRLEQLIVTLVASALVDLEPPRDGRGPRCRIAVVARTPRVASVRMAIDRPLPALFDELARDATLAEVRLELRAHGADLRVHSSATACALRLDLPALAELEITQSAKPRANDPRRRMLVYLAEPMLAELVKAVLAECGIDAELATDAEDLASRAGAEWDLCLLETKGVSTATLEHCRQHAERVAILTGEHAPSGDWYGVLPMPFRPKALMEFVERPSKTN